MSNKPFTLFFSYSHADEDLRDKLAEHLSSLKRNKVIDAWHDRQIPAGTQWAKAIDDNLNKADIILLLISSKFLASEYCSDIEVKQAMERHNSNEARVIPIILKACDWSDEEFGALQALPKNALPVTSWSNQDEAFLDIVKGIKRAILDLKDSVAAPVAPPPPQSRVQPVPPVAAPTSKSPSAPPVSVQGQEVKKNPVELVSAKGIDYRELENLLKSKEWGKADVLTAKILLKVANREKEGWLDEDSIKIFPCKDLQTIDQLWIHYSDGMFGFSVQTNWVKQLTTSTKSVGLGYWELGKYGYDIAKKFTAKSPETDDAEMDRIETKGLNSFIEELRAKAQSMILMVHGGYSINMGLSWKPCGKFLEQKLKDCNR